MSKVEDDKILVVDGDWWWVLWVSIFVLSYFFLGYSEHVEVFRTGNVYSSYGFPYGWALCGVALLGGFSLLDINQVRKAIEAKKVVELLLQQLSF